MLSFLQYLRESLAQPEGTSRATFPVDKPSWFNSKTGQILPIKTTYHAGHVASYPEQFGLTTEQLHDAILKHENPQHPSMQTPEGQQHLAGQRVDQLKTGYNDTNRGVDSLVLGSGWVRVQPNRGEGLYAQGRASALHRLAKTVLRDHSHITSLTMDVHGANETYGHLDPTIQAVAHSLEGRDMIGDFVERGGAPHKSYSKIVRREQREITEAQEYTSAATSQSQVAKGFGVLAKRGLFKRGSVNLDLGGGRYDHGVRFLKGHGVTSHVLDPYNRSPEHNERVTKTVKERGGADTVTLFNVLNTIKEPEIHTEVLRSARGHLRPGGSLWIGVYEGDRSGVGRKTKSNSWQRNEKLRAYLPVVQKQFPRATIKHGLIHAVHSDLS